MILANPFSGKGKAEELIEMIRQSSPEVDMKVFLTRKVDDEAYQVEQLVSDFSLETDKILILGGDGTLSKVLAHLPVSIPFAYFPAGSGNDFAKSLGIDSLPDVLEAMTEDRKLPINLLTYQDGIVVNSLDFGFSAQVIAYTEKSWLKQVLKKLGLGKLVYVIYAVKTLFVQRGSQLMLTIDGKQKILSNIFFLSFTNNTYFGGGIMIWPTASAMTKNFDMVYITNRGFLGNTLSLLDILFKRHVKSKAIHHELGQSLDLSVPKELLAQIDGELVSLNQATLKTQTRYLYHKGGPYVSDW